MTHVYKLKTNAAILLLAVLGLMLFSARGTLAATSCSTLEFTTAIALPTISYSSRDVTVGDFNGDGKMDAAYVNPESGSNGVSISLGDGNGHLGYLLRYVPIGLIPTGIAVGDFNDDGKLDVATGAFYGTRIAILYGDGLGFFSSLSHFDTGFENPNAVGGAVDLNGDGRTDLVVVNKDNNTIQILFNLGNGQMKLSAPYPVGTSPRSVIAGEFNGDGKIDIATANHDSSDVSVLLGTDGMGTFSAAINYGVGQLPYSPYSIVTADFNSDGKADIAVASDEHVTVLQNNGTGFDVPVDFLAGSGDVSTSITVGDFNGDTKTDIAVAEFGDSFGGISVLLGTGTGDFLTALTFGDGLKTVAAADFNGDGRTDLITHDNTVLKLLTSKCATPDHKIDYDGDNKTDIAVWRPGEGTWYILNSSFNTFRAEQWGLGSLGDKPVPGDYDGDGRTDLAVYRTSTGSWYVRRSSDGSVQTQHFGAPGDRPVHGDFDGDLKTDYAVWRPTDGTWYIMQSSNGVIRAQNWGRQDLGDQPVQGDYDFDDKTDVAVLRTAERRWFVNNSANGSLTDVVWGTTGDVPVVFSLGGKATITTWRTSNNTWYFYQGTWLTLGGNGDVPVPGDYNGDGLIDTAVLDSATGSWYIRGNGSVPIRFGIAGDVPVSVPYVLD